MPVVLQQLRDKLFPSACVFAFHGQQHPPGLQVRKSLSQINREELVIFESNKLVFFTIISQEYFVDY